MQTIEDHYQHLGEKLNEVKHALPHLSTQHMLWIASQVDALHDEIEFLRNQQILDYYDSCGKQDVHIGAGG